MSRLTAAPVLFAAVLFSGGASAAPVAPPADGGLVYVRKPTRKETRDASLAATRERLGSFTQGPWKIIGPFDNEAGRGAAVAYSPERGIDLAAEYDGADGRKVKWTDAPAFKDGEDCDLDHFDRLEHTLCYLTRVVESDRDRPAEMVLGSDDSLAAWVNGERVYAFDGVRAMPEPKDTAWIRLRKGSNRILLKCGNVLLAWRLYFELPLLPPGAVAALEDRLDEEFPSGREQTYYRLETVPTPPGICLEVGGLAFMPDGSLMIATRRGEIWNVRFEGGRYDRVAEWRLFASGLHEALGVWPGGPGGSTSHTASELYVVQRPELTRLRDTDGDGVADRFETITDAWGISGNYHEFAFGPVRDAQGNFWGTLNLAHHDAAFGEMDSIAPWRGWSFRVTPQGVFEPWSSGLRSPNGIGVSPEGDVFYTDNQGGYVGTSFLAHVTRGAFHGHPSGLHWDPAFTGDAAAMPIAELERRRKPPAVFLPHGPMGNSPSQPLWDLTGGKFGPFAGQIFVGDQTQSVVSRLMLEKVGGEWQGACVPFRGGCVSGVNRLAYAPDGSLFAGLTDRGWVASGGRSFGLQRIVWTGKVPMEIERVAATTEGFDVTFTLPVDPATASDPGAWSLQRYRYEYHKAYGSPLFDTAAVPVRQVRCSDDRRRVGLVLGERVPGMIYELHVTGLLAADRSELLHPAAYYTLNRLPR